MTLTLALEAHSDVQLVILARGGDSHAFDELVRRHAPFVLATARSLVGSDEAWDVAQETFVRAHRHLISFRGGALGAWLYRIAINEARRALDRRQRRWRFARPIAEGEDFSGPLAPPGLGDELSQAVARLPWAYRTAFVLREVSGLSYEEIARTLGCQVGTVRSRLFRAREELRRALGGEHD